jgi:hypothetical protein
MKKPIRQYQQLEKTRDRLIQRAIEVFEAPFKDVVFCEDTSPKLKGLASINFSILKSWVINLLRSHGYDSITEAINSLSHALKALSSLCSI